MALTLTAGDDLQTWTPMAREKSSENDALQTSILAEATRLIAERGYDAVSMRQIARAVGCSATAIYLFFENKDELLFTAVQGAFDEFVASLREAAASEGSPRERLARIGMAYITFGLDHPQSFRLMFVDKPNFLLSPAVRDRAPRLNDLEVLRTTVGEVLDAPSSDARVKTAADALWACVHGVAALHVSRLGFGRERALAAGDRVTQLMSKNIVLE